jgi:hypothetical protein
MNVLSFTASLIASLSWPAVAIAAMLLFRRPLANLIARIRSYKGMGQEVEFGELLAVAEESAKQAIETAAKTTGKSAEAEEMQGELSPLIQAAESNPSYVIIRAWEDVQASLADLAGIVFPGRAVRGFPSRLISDLESQDIGLPHKYFETVREFRDLRNRVAHGQHNPTPGEAITYAESADWLVRAARLGIEHYLSQEKSTLG